MSRTSLSSPPQQSGISSPTSPDRGSRNQHSLSIIFDEKNNSEFSNREALDCAKLQREEVRKHAIRVYELHELREEHDRIMRDQKLEEERLRREAEYVAEQARLEKLKSQKVTPPPKSPTPPPPPALSVSQSAATSSLTSTTPKHPTSAPVSTQTPSIAISTPIKVESLLSTTSPATASPIEQQQQSKASPDASALPSSSLPAAVTTPVIAQVKNAPNEPATPVASTAQPSTLPQASEQPSRPLVALTQDRYQQIHQSLKQLRKNMEQVSQTPGSPLKGKVGDMRREIRKSMGQLREGKGANVQQIAKIKAVLRSSLDGSLPSPMVDVSTYVLEPRPPLPEATPSPVSNQEQLPSLFLYLINIFAKSIVSQFINECGANPKAAEPIGVVAAGIFAEKDFQWRGISLVDLLIAKYRVVCPVLFGARGNDRTVSGRVALGWRREGNGFIPEQMHRDRMAGLGVGFAAIGLRDFGKSPKKNPFPPYHYWKSLAALINTPPDQISETQFIVLKAMLDGYEQRFLQFYGNIGLLVLKMAVFDFPHRGPKSPGRDALLVLGETLQSERGVPLIV